MRKIAFLFALLVTAFVCLLPAAPAASSGSDDNPAPSSAGTSGASQEPSAGDQAGSSDQVAPKPQPRMRAARGEAAENAKEAKVTDQLNQQELAWPQNFE